MHLVPTWQHVMLHDLPACACVLRTGDRDYARIACPDCRGAGVAATPPTPTPPRTVDDERGRCLDAVIAAWNTLATRCLVDRRQVRGSDLNELVDDIRSRIAAGGA